VKRGIETVYRSIVFRSRAEARWAAFFDLLGWPWQYELLDLSGYIPDFIIGFDRPLLFEVKGDVLPSDVVSSETVRLACSKVELSGWPDRALVAGSAPLLGNDEWPTLGLFAAMVDGDDLNGTDAALFHCLACDAPSINSAGGSYRCLRCGAYDGDRYVSRFEDANDLWANACNATQWKPAA